MAGASSNRSLPSNMKRQFGATESVRLSRSTFDLSKTWKGTFSSGKLIPFFVSEGLPGDSRRVRIQAIARLATPTKPYMDNLYLDFHFWWCPSRQLMDNWVKLMGEQERPTDSIDFLVPQVAVEAAEGFCNTSETMGDYMGLPPRDASHVTADYKVSALPARMYNRVWNFHYRDQNFQNSLSQPTGDADDSSTIYKLRARGKRHDYLTAALPFQQKGDPVPLAVGGSAPIYTTDAALNVENISPPDGTKRTLTGVEVGFNNQFSAPSAGAGTLFADLGSSSSATVTQLRYSIAIQHILERDARGGTRYPEILMSRFGVVDPQMQVLQRPEYLGGGTVPINVNPVPQTTDKQADGSGSVQGNLAATALATVDGIGFTKSFTEHGFIMGLVSARADLTYQQGVERMWSRRERFDFYHPELAHISEQAIRYSEIYVTGDPVLDDANWGFIGAYDEYRYGMSLITGKFRSSSVTPLDFWHLSQFFQNRPTLGEVFIADTPPVSRVIAVQNEPEFIMDAFISDIAARPLPVTGIPGLARI